MPRLRLRLVVPGWCPRRIWHQGLRNKHIKKWQTFALSFWGTGYAHLTVSTGWRLCVKTKYVHWWCIFLLKQCSARVYVVKSPPLFDLFVFQTPYRPAVGFVGRNLWIQTSVCPQDVPLVFYALVCDWMQFLFDNNHLGWVLLLFFMPHMPECQR